MAKTLTKQGNLRKWAMANKAGSATGAPITEAEKARIEARVAKGVAKFQVKIVDPKNHMKIIEVQANNADEAEKKANAENPGFKVISEPRRL